MSESVPELAKRLRTQRGWSQERLARELGVSFASVNAWERGRSTPRATHLAKLEALASAAEAEARGPMRILIVDDDPTSILVLDGHLAASPHDLEVATASNGQEALLMVGAVRPHLLLLDVMMPDIDGIEVAQRLPAIPALEGVRVVFTTAASDDAATRARMDAVSPRGILGKPIDATELARIVDQVQQEIHP